MIRSKDDDVGTRAANFPAVSEVYFFFFSQAGLFNVQTKMPYFRETRACIAYAYRNTFRNEQEFLLLYNSHKFPEFPYLNYEKFDLDEKTRPSFDQQQQQQQQETGKKLFIEL